MTNVQHTPRTKPRTTTKALAKAGSRPAEVERSDLPGHAEWRDELTALRRELEGLRAELAREVRTERLVVVHPDDGRELVRTTVLDEAVTLTVQWEPDEAAVMIGSDHESAEGPGAWLLVTSGGNTVADLVAVPIAGGGHYGSLSLERETSDGSLVAGLRLDGGGTMRKVRR